MNENNFVVNQNPNENTIKQINIGYFKEFIIWLFRKIPKSSIYCVT
jgi:hypothetical protein